MFPTVRSLATLALSSFLGLTTGCSVLNGYPDVDSEQKASTGGEDPAPTPWMKSYGGVGNDVASAIAIGPKDSIVMAGSFSDTVDFGLGPLHSYGQQDAFLVGLDHNGGVLWNAAWGGANNDLVDGLVTTPDGDFVVAFAFSGDADLGGTVLSGEPLGFGIVRYRADGEIVWARSLSGFEGRTWGALAATDDGGLVLTGVLQGTVDFGFGPTSAVGQADLFVLRLDDQGATSWCHHFKSGSPESDTATNFIRPETAPDGSVLLTGWLEAGLDFGTFSVDPDEAQGFIAKLAPDGELAWARMPKSPGDLQVYKDLAIEEDGSLVTVGAYLTPASYGPAIGGLLLNRFDGDGNRLETQRFQAAPNYDWSVFPVSLVPNRVGGYTVLGYMNRDLTVGQQVLKSVGGEDTFVVRLGEDLLPLDALRFGDGQDESPWAAAVDGKGSVMVGGSFTGQLRFDQETRVSNGMSDAFLAKIVWDD